MGSTILYTISLLGLLGFVGLLIMAANKKEDKTTLEAIERAEEQSTLENETANMGFDEAQSYPETTDTEIVEINLDKEQHSPENETANMDFDDTQSTPETEANNLYLSIEQLTERTINIIKESLEAIGCQLQKTEEDDYITKYQGETFEFVFGGPYVRIYDLGWANTNVNDSDYQILREAINLVNHNHGPTIVLSEPNLDGVRYIHSHTYYCVHPEFPDNAYFLQNQLNLFFLAKDNLRKEYHGVIAEQQQAQQSKRNPIGFATKDEASSEEK